MTRPGRNGLNPPKSSPQIPSKVMHGLTIRDIQNRSRSSLHRVRFTAGILALLSRQETNIIGTHEPPQAKICARTLRNSYRYSIKLLTCQLEHAHNPRSMHGYGRTRPRSTRRVRRSCSVTHGCLNTMLNFSATSCPALRRHVYAARNCRDEHLAVLLEQGGQSQDAVLPTPTVVD
jgi:hypothetical protein